MWRVSYKKQLVLVKTHYGDQSQGQRRMEQVTTVSKKTTFFLLVLAVSASAKSLNTVQQNTAITATNDRQVRSALYM